MLSLVVVTPFSNYRIGQIIADPTTIDSIRLSEYAGEVVLISDEVIPPPNQPPPLLDLSQIQAAVANLTAITTEIKNADFVTGAQAAALQSAIAQLNALSAAQAQALSSNSAINDQQNAALQAALAQINGLNTALSTADQTNVAQSTALTQQQSQINSLAALVVQLEAKINNPTTSPPVAPNLADDLPLTENDNQALSTDSGAVLVGDRR